MFSLLHGFYEELTYIRERPVALLGVEASGKSCVLEWLKHHYSPTRPKTLSPESLQKIIPTVGLNVAKLRVSSERLLVWDLGGAPGLRPIWTRYVDEAEAIIWVVDSADPSRLEDSRTCLKEILTRKNLQKSPLLVFANKQDLEDAVDPVKISLSLDLLSDAELRPQCVQPCSTQTGEGIQEGLQWLLSSLKGEAKHGMRIP